MDLAALETLLGYQFVDKELLVRSLTHRSWANEKLAGESEARLREAQNESLEFVGDSVVGLVIAETLYRRHPALSEGDLTLMKHRLVSTPTLAEIASELRLGEHLRLGRGEEKTGGREKPALLADAMEAVIAAVFFDGGYENAAKFVGRIFEKHLDRTTPKASGDFKTKLQEVLQARKLSAPAYTLIRSEGMPHSRTFVVEAAWEGGRSIGTGRSIKSAEMMAASEALILLGLAETSGATRP